MSSLYRSITAKLPTAVNPTVRRLAIASLIGQAVLIGTGGAVRLTSSGLGCPTWPRCTPESLVNTPEMGIHGIIEFGNRALTFVLAIIAVSMLVFLWNLRKERKDLFWLAFGLLASIPAQAIIGGLSVLTKLNPWVVGLHFLVSSALVVFAKLLVNRAYGRPPASQKPVRPLLRQLALTSAVLVGIAVVIGVMVTGSGPHAGDANAPRNGLDSDLITRIHVLPVYLLVAVSVLLLVVTWKRGKGDLLRSASLWLIATVVLQAVIGYTQHFTGLPPLLVGLHMLGAAALLAAGTNVADVALHSRRA
ncbi:heme O monooxygenase [Renibacterium salmoninarum ATCC 33209]|uniref:Heme O monooxygenase n=1 Tax=Renibacterium salmoninarum (strain ATCC 33209 / DSM 20767 / JCM 11484 / NBRC 15589 / NCIMB 2235) TaxID=288705 RepID=A9WT37_RENSM|nr:COX15/CtaA family protein [Renibacterium salmoninarum]ABY23975.1 heme O monooxygenase [Renibacterium salmoninarum ATCC 33209]